MAAIDYAGVLTSLKALLDADSRTNDARTYIEEDPQYGLSDSGKVIVLTLNRRSATAGQSLAAGKRQRYLLSVGVWSVAFDMASFDAAAAKRDALLAQVELVLMDNRTLSGKVVALNLTGGEFFSVRNPEGTVFTAMAETVIEAEVSAINT